MTRNEAAPSQRILVLTPQFPYPPHQGTTMRNYNLIAGLAGRHEVHLLSFGDPAVCQGTPLDDLCQTVQAISPALFVSIFHRLAAINAAKYPSCIRSS